MSRSGANLPSTQLELLPQGYLKARELLARATKFDEVHDFRNKAEAFRVYAIQARDREAEILAAELRFHAERRAGGMLDQAKKSGDLQKQGGDRRSKFPDGILIVPTLKELGITAKEAMAWQRVARLSDKEFELRLKKLRENGFRGSTNGFIRNGAFSSETDLHLTPREVLDPVVEVLGKIDLDPCAEAHGDRANVPARDHYTGKDDGLSKPWKGRVYMNPPYGLEIQEWVAALVNFHKSGNVPEAIALVAARTDTIWFKLLDEYPVCFWTGRLHFSGADNGAMFPSAIFYLGTLHRAAFERRFSQLGSVRPPALISAAPTRKGPIDG
jgi:DNA N-6-adenine-methyltransferase (Dam)